MEIVPVSQRSTMRRYVRTECEVVRERGFRLLGWRAIDVSLEGLLVASSADVFVGEEVIVAFRGPRSREWFDACGRIARVDLGRRRGDSDPGLAVKFDGLENITKALLSAQLAGLPPPLPRRRTRMDYAAMVRDIGTRPPAAR